jgi:hypothetical protein
MEPRRREGDATIDKLVKVIVFAFIGWAVGEIAEEHWSRSACALDLE